jgi:copper(I)-binding protein
MRLHHGRIYLLVGCNEACSIYAHGHLNLRRGRRHLGLRSVRTNLAADRTVRITLSLSHRNLSAVHRALERHRSVKAAIVLEATGAGGTTASPWG